MRALLSAGYLPLDSRGLFPTVELTPEETRQAFQAAIANGTMPDFSTMSAEDVRSYLEEHPELSDAMLALMVGTEVDPAINALVQAQAAIDADTIAEALDDDEPDADTLAAIDRSTALLNGINAAVAAGAPLTNAQATYVAAWTDGVGSEDIARIPEVVDAAVRTTMAGAPSYAIEAAIQGHVAPVADAILNYTNPGVHEPNALPSIWPSTDANPSGRPYPDAICELLDLRIGDAEDGYRYGHDGGFDSIDGLATFDGWGRLLASASEGVEPGDDFAGALAESALQAKQDMNAILAAANAHNDELYAGWDQGSSYDKAYPNFLDLEAIAARLDDSGSSDLLSVVARNEDASSTVVLDEDQRRALLGLNWNDDGGAIDLIRAATDRDPEGGGTTLQAQAALALIQEVGENRTDYLGGRYDSNGDGEITEADAMAVSRITEGISDAVVDVGINWIDQFGDAHDSGQRDETHGVAFDMSPDTESLFLRFVSGTGDEDAVRFHTAASWQSQVDLTQAMESGDPAAIQAALDRAGRLEGRIVGADVEWQIDVAAGNDAQTNQDAQAEYDARQRQLAALRLLADIGTSAIPGLSAGENAGALLEAGVRMLNSGSDKVESGFLDQLFGSEGPPVDTHAAEIASKADGESVAHNDMQTVERRLAVQAALSAGLISADDLGSLTPGDYTVGSDGQVVLGADVDAEDLGQVYYGLGLDQGTYSSGWTVGYDGSNHHRAGSGAWTEDDDASSYLYGENADRWEDDRAQHAPTSPYGSPTYDDDPYDVTDPSEIEENDPVVEAAQGGS